MEPYLFVDEAGFIADRERLSPVEAQLRNAYAAPGQALRWKLERELTGELIGNCLEKLRVLKSRPVSTHKLARADMHGEGQQ